MVSSLDETLALLSNAKKEGKEFCMALTGKGFSFWYSAGEVRDVSGTRFEFSTNTGEPVTAMIDLNKGELVNQPPSQKPISFQPSIALSEIPVLQVKLESGCLLELFERTV